MTHRRRFVLESFPSSPRNRKEFRLQEDLKTLMFVAVEEKRRSNVKIISRQSSTERRRGKSIRQEIDALAHARRSVTTEILSFD